MITNLRSLRSYLPLVAIVGMTFVIASCDRSHKTKFDSEADKNLYFLGTKFGSGVATLKLSESEAKVVAQGFQDAMTGKEIADYDGDDRGQKVQDFLEARKGSTAENNEKVGKEFLNDFVGKGGKKTASGLAYTIVKEGEGDSPSGVDVVDINYSGTLTDGTIFAASAPKQPSRYPLDKIVAGWAEGIQLIKPGGKIQLVIPPELGYGANGLPPKVPGGATLVMDVELLTVTKMKGGAVVPKSAPKSDEASTTATELKAEAKPPVKPGAKPVSKPAAKPAHK